MKLIGIGGTNAAGKDIVREMLEDRHDWMTVSTSDILREEAGERGQPIEREVLRTISAEWRREYGLGVLIDRAVELYRNSGKKYSGLEIGSIRNPGEADRIHGLGGTLVWVDADPKIRYQRLVSRARSDEDRKTYEQFLEEERAEMQHSSDEATLSLAGVKKKADIFLLNNGDDVEAFKDEAEKALAVILKG